MRAASSGKYVFSTLHTRDVASTLTALRDLHLDLRSLAGNLTGIISQRLVRRLCPQCRRPTPLRDEQHLAPCSRNTGSSHLSNCFSTLVAPDAAAPAIAAEPASSRSS